MLGWAFGKRAKGVRLFPRNSVDSTASVLGCAHLLAVAVAVGYSLPPWGRTRGPDGTGYHLTWESTSPDKHDRAYEVQADGPDGAGYLWVVNPVSTT